MLLSLDCVREAITQSSQKIAWKDHPSQLSHAIILSQAADAIHRLMNLAHESPMTKVKSQVVFSMAVLELNAYELSASSHSDLVVD